MEFSRLRKAEAKPTGRAGRNLPLAVASGLILGALFLLSILWRLEIFWVLIAAFIFGAIWELHRGLLVKKIRVPRAILLVGGIGSSLVAFRLGQVPALCMVLLTAVAAILARVLDYYLHHPQKTLVGNKKLLGDLAGIGLVVCYGVFLPTYFLLLPQLPSGIGLLVLTILLAVCNDTGGWLFGIFFGKHPLAPSVSPKKSWEGALGSLVACLLASVIASYFLPPLGLIGAIILAPLAVITATAGDLAESLLKRDLGLKDMGNIFPGHGGVLDRVDSMLFMAPVVYAFFS